MLMCDNLRPSLETICCLNIYPDLSQFYIHKLWSPARFRCTGKW